MMVKISRKFRINIVIECDSRADYLAALTAVRAAKGSHVDSPAGTDVVVRQSAKDGIDLKELDAP